MLMAMILFVFVIYLLLFLATLHGFWDLSSLTRGIEPGTMAVKVQSPNHYTTRKFLGNHSF